MAKIEWVEERLVNWARWRTLRGGAGVLGFAGVQLGGANAGRSGYVTSSVPVLEVEASDTDEAVQRLNPRGLALTLIEVYCEPGTVGEHAAKLCCSVPTIYARLDQAHRQLADHFLAQQTRQRTERERVERLQRGLSGVRGNR